DRSDGRTDVPGGIAEAVLDVGVNDLGPLDVVTIRSAAYDMLDEQTPAGPAASCGKPILTLIRGGAA
ncbi:hypothetical protein, partial [Mycobacterium timonense]